VRQLHRIHLAGSQHGYICPENIVVARGDVLANPRLVNFEHGIPDPTLHASETSKELRELRWRRPYDCPEKAVYYSARGDGLDATESYDPLVHGDLFSLGQTLLFLASGEDESGGPPLQPFVKEELWRDQAGEVMPWRKVTQPVRRSNTAVKSIIYRKVSSPDRSYEDAIAMTEVIFACLRLEEHRFHNVRSVLDVLQRFRPSDGPTEPLAYVDPPGVKQAIGSLENALNQPALNCVGMLRTLYRDRLRRMTRPFEDSELEFRFTVGKGREEIVDAMVLMLLQLQSRQNKVSAAGCCRGLTTPAFFFHNNCGPAGRVWSAMKIAAFRGATLNWMFLLNESRMNEPLVVEVLSSMKSDLERGPKQVRDHLKIGWLPLPQRVYKDRLRTTETFVLLDSYDELSKRQTSVLVKPDYSSDMGRLTALRVFPAESGGGWDDCFARYWKLQNDIQSFPHRE
jgi:hypothetical protein